GKGSLYPKMFASVPNSQCTSCYTVSFTSAYASFGAFAGIYFNMPTANIVWSPNGVIEPTLHEFSHSVHQALAPQSFSSVSPDYQFGSSAIDSNGVVLVGIHNRGQLQEMNTAFLEGLATGLGAYFVNGCKGERDWNQLYVVP